MIYIQLNFNDDDDGSSPVRDGPSFSKQILVVTIFMELDNPKENILISVSTISTPNLA